MLSFTPLGRSAAELISFNKRFLSSCVPLDKLLGDGLPAGHVLELSGPPGTAKETLAIKFASGAVSPNDQVLFVGRAPTPMAKISFSLCTRHAKHGQPYLATFRASYA
jgi:hypothetical protein